MLAPHFSHSLARQSKHFFPQKKGSTQLLFPKLGNPFLIIAHHKALQFWNSTYNKKFSSMTSIHFKRVAMKMMKILLKEGLNWGESLRRLFRFASLYLQENFVIPTYNVNGMTFCSFFFFFLWSEQRHSKKVHLSYYYVHVRSLYILLPVYELVLHA